MTKAPSISTASKMKTAELKRRLNEHSVSFFLIFYFYFESINNVLLILLLFNFPLEISFNLFYSKGLANIVCIIRNNLLTLIPYSTNFIA